MLRLWSSTLSFQLSAKLHVLERNCICSTSLRPKEFIWHLSRNSQQICNDLRNIKPEKGAPKACNSYCHDTSSILKPLNRLWACLILAMLFTAR